MKTKFSDLIMASRILSYSNIAKYESRTIRLAIIYCNTIELITVKTLFA